MKKSIGGFRPGIRKKNMLNKYNKEFIEETQRLFDIAFRKLAYEDYIMITGSDEVIDGLSKIFDIERVYAKVGILERGEREFPIKFIKKDDKLEMLIDSVCKHRHYERKGDIDELIAVIFEYDKLTGMTAMDDTYISREVSEDDRIETIRTLIREFIPTRDKLDAWDKEFEKEAEIEEKIELMNTAVAINLIKIAAKDEKKKNSDNKSGE